ncbi:hypothetical protein [Marinobacter sp. ANT_B65]|uniref:hypothetical protein n=1 Tax=Marinobacter sp. ANT_B65 TaxID=2039467 RepID=UPI000BBE95AB|nr:hypothetical protein [Marinobacter sp. ANT_B65]PCM43753.1 hypothetical protein CPA50_15465 [Marinobacter sp. ANT_B65]
MSECYKSGHFQKYFNENMDALGLPYPTSFFDSYNATVAHLTVMVDAIKTLGKGATVAELIGATTGLERLKIAAAFGASAYVGAVIGSLAVATGRSLGCGSRISDLFVIVEKNKLPLESIHGFYARNPQILDLNHPFRSSFGVRVKTTPESFEYA